MSKTTKQIRQQVVEVSRPLLDLEAGLLERGVSIKVSGSLGAYSAPGDLVAINGGETVDRLMAIFARNEAEDDSRDCANKTAVKYVRTVYADCVKASEVCSIFADVTDADKARGLRLLIRMSMGRGSFNGYAVDEHFIKSGVSASGVVANLKAAAEQRLNDSIYAESKRLGRLGKRVRPCAPDAVATVHLIACSGNLLMWRYAAPSTGATASRLRGFLEQVL